MNTNTMDAREAVLGASVDESFRGVDGVSVDEAFASFDDATAAESVDGAREAGIAEATCEQMQNLAHEAGSPIGEATCDCGDVNAGCTHVAALDHAEAQAGESRPTLRKRIKSLFTDETGATTAEYVITTMAAVGLAGLLVVILSGDEVRTMLLDMVRSAFSFGR